MTDAKARGVSRDRKASMAAQGLGPTAIAKALKIGRASVYQALEGAK